MSDRTNLPPDDDARLAALWREHSTELPPAHLDAAILAAARREAGSKPRAADDDDALAEAREPSRWWWGLAAAATIGAVAFGVIQLAPLDPNVVQTTVSDVPPATTAATPAPPAAVPPPPEAKLAEPAGVPPQDETRRAGPDRAPPQAAAKITKPEAVKPRAAAPRPPVEPRPFPSSREAAPLQRMEQAAPALPPTSVPVPPPLPAPARERAAAADTARSAAPAAAFATSPGPFIERIQRALDEARPEEAKRELAAFRAAFPDADERLPERLKAWAAGVPRQTAPRHTLP